MSPSRLISTSFLLVSVAAFGPFALAQTPQATFGTAGMESLSGAPVVHALPPVQPTCPVLRAQQRAAGSLQQAGENRPKGLAQRLHISLADPQARQIVSAHIRVHGLSGKARTAQALSNSVEADSARNLEVRFSAAQSIAGQAKAAEADLWVPAMTAVLKIDLNSVTYADGSTRTFSAHDNCRVVPDPTMLISTR